MSSENKKLKPIKQVVVQWIEKDGARVETGTCTAKVPIARKGKLELQARKLIKITKRKPYVMTVKLTGGVHHIFTNKTDKQK